MSTADLDKLAAVADSLRQTVVDAAIAWPQPTEIKSELPPAPAFDAATLLPNPLRDFVLDEADRMPCSPDYVAVALVVALGAVIGARMALKPKRRGDWIVTANLFGGVVGDPSSKKTPAINTAMRYLDRLEAKEAERHGERMKVWAPVRKCRVLAGFKMLRGSQRHLRGAGVGAACGGGCQDSA
jgi:hypothetical protein